MTLREVMKQRRHSRGPHGRRFYTATDMAMIKHDAAAQNGMARRGVVARTNNRYVVVCGCGAEGCFIHGSF